MSPVAGGHRPGSVLAAATLGFSVAAAALVGTRSELALFGTAVGVGALTVGLVRSARRLAGIGALAVLAGVLAGGRAGVAPERLLPAVAAALLGWEFALETFAVRTELRDGTVERAELLHVVTATAVGALLAGSAYGLYLAVNVGVSITALLLLLVATVSLGLALRD